VCNKIASNFIPNNEGLFYIFHLFPTCSIQVPNGFPLVTPFFIRGSHKMVTKKVLVTIRGGGSKEGKNGGWGEGKDIVVIQRFLITTWAWRPKTF
jgi:hypothetical protein